MVIDRAGHWPRLQRARRRILREAREAEEALLAAERDAVAYFEREAVG